MPKIRKKADQSVSFQVSGWQGRRPKSEEKSFTYRETFIPIKSPPSGPPADLQPGEARPASTREPLSSSTYLSSEPAAPSPLISSTGWRTKRKAKHPLEPVGCCKVAEPSGERETSLEHVYNHDDDEASAAKIHGQGLLALLPDGSLSGHLFDPISRSTYGLMGKDVLSWAECTRDEDWRILRVALIDFRNGLEASFLVQRTGMDGATLHCPVEAHGIEPELLTSIEAPTDCKNVVLHFECERIYSGAAAEERLEALNPRLCGHDAIVITGDVVATGLVFTPT